MRRLITIITLVLVSLTAFAVFAQQPLPPVNPAEVTGDIAIAGTEKLVELTSNLATRFSLEGYTGILGVNGTTSDLAFEQLCSGVIDIAMSDRPINQGEIDACTVAGNPPIAFRVASAGTIVAVSRQNNFANNITLSDLNLIYSSALAWSDVRPEWTTDPIARYGTATTSGEFQLFADVVFGGNTSIPTTAIGAQYNEDPNVNLQAIAVSNTAIGFFPADFVIANSNLLQGVTIDGVAPSFTTIVDNSYPLSQQLFLYTTTTAFQTKPQVADFLNYYLTNGPDATRGVGLFPATGNSQQISASRWLTASGASAQVVASTPTELAVDDVAATATTVAIALAGGDLPTAVAPTDIPIGPTQVFEPEVQELLINARLDLELVATELLGSDRPPGWSASLDIENPQLTLLTRLDLELLAAIVYGIEERPDNWFGAVNGTRVAIARDIRHDLEIIADEVLGETRPINWAGADPLLSCDRATQALVTLLTENGLYTVDIAPSAPNYCQLLVVDVSQFVEVNFSGTQFQVGEDGLTIPADVTIETTFAVGFFSTNANVRAGVIPLGEGIIPIARSYQGISNMTLVEGADFLLFIEWQNTSLTREEWEALPNVADISVEAFCAADWCG